MESTGQEHPSSERGLDRHPVAGAMPSDPGVQAERQEEGVEGEIEAERVEARRREQAEAPIRRSGRANRRTDAAGNPLMGHRSGRAGSG